MASISGPYRITASARNITIPNVTLRDGTLTNTCGADGSERTIAADCTVPAGTETRVVNGWYCTNRPNFDVAVSLALPNGGLGIPITNVSVGANFSPGGGAYTHSTTVSLNGSLVGSAIVPSQSRIQGNVAPQTLILGGSSPTQLLNLRSTHTNGTHYTVASGFTVTVDYDEHTRTGCFTQAEIDAAAGGTLMCAPDSSLIVPLQELSLNLTVDPAAEAPQNADGAFVFTVGEQIPLIAEVSAVGQTNLTDPVEIELSVPRGLRPQGMTIQNEDPIVLSEIFETLVCLVTGDSNCGNLLNDIVEIALTPDTVRYTYTIEEPVIVGQPFPITLEVIGEVVGTFTLSGQASLSPSDVEGTGPFSFDSSSGFQVNANSVEAFLSLQVTPSPADYYTQFRGIIFWAIYNETNENQQIPLSEALPGVETSIPNSITNQDHRYLMARTILNNIPFEDVSAGVAYMRRWGGSIGDTSYRLWSKQGGRVACEFEGEPIALSYATAAGESDAAIVRWFNGYMECLRTGQPLENRQLDYDEAYGDITGFIDAAIADHVNGASNPIPGAEFVKHTSTCFVWQRDSSGRLTSCHGDRGRINMQTFCDASPYVASPTDGATPTPTPAPNRNCRSSSINPSSVVVTEWLASDEGHDSNQQLGLETVVGWRNLINLGFYRPDQPLRRSDGSPTSGQGCENNCYFLLGNPILEENGHLRESIDAETRTEAWERHEAAQINPDYGYRGNAQSYLVHVLREEDSGDETWITTVFQQGAN